jgi:hypothetical protein
MDFILSAHNEKGNLNRGEKLQREFLNPLGAFT